MSLAIRIKILLFFCLFSVSQAEILKANYKLSFGILGEFGTAQAVLKTENKTYEIITKAQTSGVAKTLSGNRQEIFISKGEKIGEIFVPKLFTHEITRIKNGKKRREFKIYEFDHKVQKIAFTKLKHENNELISKQSKILEFYAKNDILSLFFNFKILSRDFTAQNRQNFALYAVGANKKDGRVDIKIPNEKEQKSLAKSLGNGENFIVFINEKIFSSKKGELHLSLDQNGTAKKAILRDVLLFGDIRVEIF